MQALSDKDKTISQLALKLTQRDGAIKNLEDFVVFQNSLLNHIHASSEKESVYENGNTVLGGKKSKEMSSRFQKHSEESDELISSLFATLERQKGKLRSMQEELSSAKQNIDNENRIEEMKIVIQDLQSKLDDRNNTNINLIRSINMQNELIADLRLTNTKLKISSKKKDCEQITSTAEMMPNSKPDQGDNDQSCIQKRTIQEWNKTLLSKNKAYQALVFSITRQNESYLERLKKKK
jgi:hypothetical protein